MQESVSIIGVVLGSRQGNLPNDAVCALAQLLGHIIALIDNEILVEDLEDLATL